jgi:hypothetical protein
VFTDGTAGSSMTDSNGTQGNDHESYAQFCLKLAASTRDRDARVTLREMAAQWLKLCEGNGHSNGGSNRRDDSQGTKLGR